MKRIMSLIAITAAAVTSLMACGKKASTEAGKLLSGMSENEIGDWAKDYLK